jgi:hypothetical protein
MQFARGMRTSIAVLALLALSCARPARGTGDAAATSPGGQAATRALAADASRGQACLVPETSDGLHRMTREAAGHLLAPKSFDELFGPSPRFLASPLLPDRWPDPKGVVTFLYRDELLPGSMGGQALMSPEWKVVISPLGAAPTLERMERPKRAEVRLGHAWDPKTAATAEGVLVEIIAGCKPFRDCRDLAGYREWLQSEQAVADWLRKDHGLAFPCLR